MPLNIKNTNNFTRWKNGSVDVTITQAITHQKHLAQFGRKIQASKCVRIDFCFWVTYSLIQWSISDVRYLHLIEKLLGDNLFRIVFNNR